MHALFRTAATSCFAMLFAFTLPIDAAPKPITVKVVVVAMFEIGQDSGDQPGELQYWVERDHLDQVYPLPAGYHSARMNSNGEMAILTGQGTAHAAATIMALGLDPRFDFSHAYWLVAGIAGGSPDRISLGSAAWARWVVDGDLGYEIDPREMPPDWSTGYIPLRKARPFEPPATPPRRPGLRTQSQACAMGLRPHSQHAARRSRHPQGNSYSLRRRCRPASAFRHSRRHDVLVHLLARKTLRRLGQRVGQLLHRRQRASSQPPRWRTPARCNL